MSNLSKRIMATRLLRDIFIISLIVSVCTAIVTIITVVLWDMQEIPQALGVTVSILLTVFSIMSAIVIVMIAATLIITIGLNKQCKIAFFGAVLAAILVILSSIFQHTLTYRATAYILEFISELAIAGSLYFLIDGLYDHKYRKTSLAKYAGMGCVLMVLSSLFTLIAFVSRVNAAGTTMFYTMGIACTIAYSTILLISMNSALKDTRLLNKEPEQKESEAL